MMIKKLQEKLVVEIVNVLGFEWDRASINIEIDDINGELVQSEMSFVFFNETKEEFDLEDEVYDLFESLRDEMYNSNINKKLWTVCDLEISANGKYKFLFHYDTPPRLSSLK